MITDKSDSENSTVTEPTAFFIFDVESVGLHGEGFAVAGGVYLPNGAVQYEFSFACPVNEALGGTENRRWVMNNVPVLEETHRTPFAIRTAFWDQWLLARKQYPGIVMAAECGWPVEARFLCACVDSTLSVREWEGPYPLHEIASYMEAAGMDPMKTYERTPSEMPPHNPLTDSRLSARLLFEAREKIREAL